MVRNLFFSKLTYKFTLLSYILTSTNAMALPLGGGEQAMDIEKPKKQTKDISRIPLVNLGEASNNRVHGASSNQSLQQVNSSSSALNSFQAGKRKEVPYEKDVTTNKKRKLNSGLAHSNPHTGIENGDKSQSMHQTLCPMSPAEVMGQPSATTVSAMDTDEHLSTDRGQSNTTTSAMNIEGRDHAHHSRKRKELPHQDTVTASKKRKLNSGQAHSTTPTGVENGDMSQLMVQTRRFSPALEMEHSLATTITAAAFKDKENPVVPMQIDDRPKKEINVIYRDCFNKFPPELIQLIISFLSFKDRRAFEITSRRFQAHVLEAEKHMVMRNQYNFPVLKLNFSRVREMDNQIQKGLINPARLLTKFSGFSFESIYANRYFADLYKKYLPEDIKRKPELELKLDLIDVKDFKILTSNLLGTKLNRLMMSVNYDLAAPISNLESFLIEALHLEDLHTLDFSFEIRDDSEKSLTKFLEALRTSHLHRLRLSGSTSNGIDVKALAKTLASDQSRSKLRTLVLEEGSEYDNLGDEDVQILASALPQSNLTELCISTTYMTENGVGALLKGLPPQLHSLELFGSCVPRYGVESLAATIMGSHLRSLKLPEAEIDDTKIEIIAKAIPGSHLTSLNLSTNDFGNKGAQALAEALPKSKIISLNVSENVIGEIGTLAIITALPRCMKNLDISACLIGDTGAQALAAALSYCKFTHLNISFCHIGSDGILAIIKALPRSMVKLDLSHNCVGVEGVKLLARVLPRPMTSLSLHNTNIGNGIQALAEALPESHVTELCLGNNNLMSAGARALAKVLPGSALTSLNLRHNHIDSDGILALAESIEASNLNHLFLIENECSPQSWTRLQSIWKDKHGSLADLY